MGASRSLRRGLISIATTGFSLLLLLTPQEAQADEYFDRCMERGSTTADFAICGSEWVEREEAALTQAWRRVYNSLEPGAAKIKLLNEQRLWIAYKDAACGLFSNAQTFGSLGWAISLPACRAQVISDRVEILNGYHYDR